jgi:hypothetical protein
MLLRVFGSVWAMFAIFFLALMSGRADRVLFSTSPPMIGVLGILVASLKHAAAIYWAMDLNPDQLVMMGKLRETSPIYRAIESANRMILARSRLVVVLDRFMSARLHRAGRRPKNVLILPPWPHEQAIESLAHAENPFRDQHGLAGKFVVMYSGNHSPANPLNTVLQAAERLRDDDSLRFLFIGGGMDKPRVEAFIRDHQIRNAIALPYQPMSTLRYSLSAADVHVVTLGDNMVGVVHPCKVYGAMAVGRPILFVGPQPSHVSDLLDATDFGRAVNHGDVDACVAAIRSMQALEPARLRTMGDTAQRLLHASLSQELVNGKFCDAIEAL